MTMNHAAQALGRLSRGVPKTITDSDRARRRQQMLAINEARAQARKVAQNQLRALNRTRQ
jgi:hypothetical protein